MLNGLVPDTHASTSKALSAAALSPPSVSGTCPQQSSAPAAASVAPQLLDKVRAWVTSTAPSDLDDAIDTDALVDEIAIRAAPLGEEEDIAKLPVLINTQYTTWHALITPPSARSSWMTACGWRCGESKRVRLLGDFHVPQDWRVLCSRCYPSLRNNLKAEAASCLRGQ